LTISSIECGRRKVVIEQVGDNFVREQLHAAIDVMDDEPLLRAEQFVGDDQLADCIVGRAAAGVADDIRVPSVRPVYFAGSSRASMRRPWLGQGKLALLSEVLRAGLIGRENFADDFRRGQRLRLGGPESTSTPRQPCDAILVDKSR
jgi:hypothetical protein